MAGLILLVDLPVILLAGYLGWRLLAGQPGGRELPIAEGVIYRRDVLTTPNRAVVHVLEIADTSAVRFTVTPPLQSADGLRAVATVATDVELDADVLINANFFTPFRDNWFLDYAPHAGDLVEPIGPVVADGVAYGRPKADWPSFWVSTSGRIGFGEIPPDAKQAVTGRQWLLKQAKTALRVDEPPYPRTAIATDAAGKRLWLVVVDGKQPRYSDGLTLGDLADFLAHLGATDAIELDGGGSSIMTYLWHNGPIVLNRPCHTKIPGRQRPTGVFLGIKVRP